MRSYRATIDSGAPLIATVVELPVLRAVRLILRVLVVAVFAIGFLSILIVGLGTDIHHARILGPSSRAGWTQIQVLDGPGPKRWNIPPGSAPGARAGTVVEVHLRGSCRCMPYVDRTPIGSRAAFIGWAMLPLGSLALVLILARLTTRKARRVFAAQRRAAGSLTADAPAWPVNVRPGVIGSRRRVRATLDLYQPSGLLVGHVELNPNAAFDPHRRFWVVGPPVVGSAVALVSEGQAQVLLPSTPLLAGAAPTESWGAEASRLLRWAEVADRSLPQLPSTGRVSLGSAPLDAGARALDDSIARSRTRLVRTVRIGFVVLAAVWLISLQLHAWLVLFSGIVVGIVCLRVAVRRITSGVAAELVKGAPHLAPWSVQIGSALLAWRGTLATPQPWTKPLPVGTR